MLPESGHVGDITRSIEPGNVGVRLLINHALSYEQIEQPVLAILEDIKMITFCDCDDDGDIRAVVVGDE